MLIALTDEKIHSPPSLFPVRAAHPSDRVCDEPGGVGKVFRAGRSAGGRRASSVRLTAASRLAVVNTTRLCLPTTHEQGAAPQVDSGRWQ